MINSENVIGISYKQRIIFEFYLKFASLPQMFFLGPIF